MNILYQIESVFLEVLIAFLPLLVFFLIFQFLYLKIPKKKFIRIFRSLMVSFIGMVLFIQGVNMSYLTSGEILGRLIASSSHPITLIVIGVILGVLVTLAEPAVKVLNIEIEKETSGYINSAIFAGFLALGVGLAVGLTMLRIILAIPFIWFIISMYVIILVLSVRSSSTFAALAYDSGGVVTGPMIATFIMAFTVGVAGILGNDPLRDGFGMVAFVAAVPIMTILILGYLYGDKT